MVARHLTMRGEVLDMERLRLQNAEQVALGNAMKNARGDQIGPGGVVVRTQEQIEQEWAAAKARKDADTKPVDIKADDGLQKILQDLAPKAKKVVSDDANFEPDSQPLQPQGGVRRRIVDSN